MTAPTRKYTLFQIGPLADVPFSVSIAQFHHEYGNFMLESIPGSPYTGSIVDLLSVGSNMSYRYFSQCCCLHRAVEDSKYKASFSEETLER